MIADFTGSVAAASTIGPYLSLQSKPRRVKARALPSSMIELGAVAVVFDLVQPAVAVGRLVHQRRQLELDKPERRLRSGLGTLTHVYMVTPTTLS